MSLQSEAQAETVQAKILAKRRAMAYLSKQPVCRARRAATRLARWTWLEPSLLQQHNAVEAGGGLHASHASPDGVETVETKGYTQRAADAPPPASSLEEAHEKLERQASCQKIAKVLAERFGCHAPGKGLEDLLLAKESEVVKLQQEVTSLRSEREQLELALEAAERRIEELTVANAKAQPVPVKESPKDLVKASSAVMTVDAVLAVGVGPSHVTEPRDEVAAIRHERLQGIQSDTMREMFLGCVELLAADIYASRAHFVLELLQNADDNEYAMGVEPTARFVCEAGEEPYIAVINNEVGLTAQDLVGMCAISKSAKKDKADRTGRKGIGFKSVFAVSSCPHILSGRYTFKFDVRRDRMGYVMPSWLDEEELLCSVPMELRRLHQEGYTVIFLPIGDASEALVKEVEGHLEALDPATLLFMRRLQRIEFRRADGRSSSMQIQARGKAEGVQHEAVQMLTEAGTSGASGPSARSSHEFFVGRRWSKGGDRESQIAIALPAPAVDVPQRAFATLPLCHSGLNLCINADWDVSASRDGVHENGHNERLAEEAAQAFAEVALELGVQLWPASPVDYLGDRPPLSRFWRKVRERFIHALMHADVPCLAVEEDPDRAEPTRLVPATQALRRPPPTAVEKTAAALVSSALLEKSVQRCFVREPLPQGVQLECFAASHFARCLPSLVEAALALQSYADRVERLTQIYRAFEELLSEPRCDLATAQDRADLARHAPCWPCMSTGGSFILCASDFGAIFTEQGSTAWDLPDTVEEAQQRWRLRVLRPEAAEALRKLPSLPEIAGLRAAPRFTHLLGLTVQMHGQEDHTAIPHSSWWRSLRIMRDIWESPSSLEVEGREVDPLEEQGLQLLDPQIMRSILLVPSTAGPRHGPGVSCPLLLGEEVSCRGAKPLAEVPLELHPAKALVEALRWERFMVFGLQADSLLVQLDIHEGRRLAHHLVDPDWWLLVQAVAPDQMDLLQHYGASLKRLPYDEAGCWNLEQCLSADFAPFLHNVRLPSPNGLAAAPVLPARATHFTPKALGFLRELGVTMAVDSRTLIDRCLKPMLEQLDLAKPLDSLPNVSRVYAALVHVEEELLPELSKRIFVPGMGVQDAGSCMYLSPNLEGYGELLGKIDLQPWYPSLRELFVDRLHVTTSLSSHGCLEALRSLRGTASSEAKKLMKLVAGLLLQLYDMVRADPASHEVELSALRKEELLPVLHQSELRWLSVSSCMWLDVASTALSAVRLVSLQVHYPELQPLFVDLLDVPLVSSVEVRERLRAAAQATAEDPSALLDAYTCLDHLCKRGAEEDEDMALHYLRKDLAEVIFLPGATEASSPEACVFLPPEQRGLAERCGKQDLGRFFPTLAHYFEQLGVQRRLSPEPVLDLLRSLREGSDGLSLATAAVASLREAYGLNMCPVDLLVHFQEEPLLLVPRQAPTKKAKNWLRSADCMWYNVPSCEEVGCPAVEGSGWSGDFEEFFLEVLGVPALQADEVAARLDVLRRKHSQTDERSNGPQCQRAVVSAYLEILIALERRLDAGCQFHNPRLVHQLRERVFIPETGFVNASKCRWRQFEVQVPGSQDWYDLSEVYGAEVEASQLQRFFVYWLSVPTTLTLDEILEGLRALRSKSRLSRWTGHSQDEGPTLPRAARWYKELGRSLRKAPSSDLQVFRDEALIYVAGTERNWRKAPECLWIKPEKCPEGWSTDREELSAQYGHDPLLKEVFTERLGVPISVRFTCTSDAPVAPVALQGKPLWILDEGEVPEARNFIDTSERRPSNEVITDGEADPGSLDEEPLGTEPTAPVSEGEVSPNPDAADAAAPSPPSPPEPVEPPSLEPEENGAEQLAEPEPPEEAAKRERENTAEDGRRPYVESNVQLRGVAADGREERRRMLERLARSVKSLKDERQMISKANKVKHHSEVCVDCNPHHDLVQVGYLESPMATEVFIPVWVERSGQKSAMDRLKVSMSSQALYRFADLLMAVSSIFSVPCHRQVHIFEEDTQTVAFNSGALFFNLRFFTEECHDQSWEEAVSFWTVSFAHELAHFESPVHDRQHGRAMEMSQRAILPRIPQILARPWGAAPGSAAVAYRTWKLRATDGGLI